MAVVNGRKLTKKISHHAIRLQINLNKSKMKEEFMSIEKRIKFLEDENERLGKAVEIALNTLEKLWMEKPRGMIKKAIKRIVRIKN